MKKDGRTIMRTRTTSTNFPQKPVPKDFLNKLGEMHTGEQELTLALPLIIKSASSRDLKALLQIHLNETKGHVKCLEAVAESLGEKMPRRRCKPMTKLIGQGVKAMARKLVSSNGDSDLIAAGRKIEQFEINSYRGLCSTAKEKNYAHELALLSSVLNQEKLADELLAGLAEGKAPLKKLVERASLKRAGAQSHNPRPASRRPAKA